MGITSNNFIKSFEIFIQLGAILAVVVLFWHRLWKNLPLTVGKLATAFAPTAIIGFFIYPVFKQYFMGNTLLMIIMLMVGGLGLIIFEKFYKASPELPGNSLSVISYKQAFVIGCAQSVAIVPGVSRAAATIIGGLLLKIPRATIVEFSFLLAIPTMAAATGLDLLKSGWAFNQNQYTLLAIGFITAFISALVVIHWLIRFVQKHDFAIFGWYRLIIGFLLLIYFYYR